MSDILDNLWSDSDSESYSDSDSSLEIETKTDITPKIDFKKYIIKKEEKRNDLIIKKIEIKIPNENTIKVNDLISIISNL